MLKVYFIPSTRLALQRTGKNILLYTCTSNRKALLQTRREILIFIKLFLSISWTHILTYGFSQVPHAVDIFDLCPHSQRLSRSMHRDIGINSKLPFCEKREKGIWYENHSKQSLQFNHPQLSNPLLNKHCIHLNLNDLFAWNTVFWSVLCTAE